MTLAFAPYGKTLPKTVAAARAGGHEVFLEIPLEPFDYPQNDPGPQTLLTGEADPRQSRQAVLADVALRRLCRGHQQYGRPLHRLGRRFLPVMEELGSRGLGYLDDGSSNRSLAPQLAAGNKVPFSRADMIIDANPGREPILAALGSLEAKAKQNGYAIGIVSALPISIATVTEWSRELENKGMMLVPASALMK